MAHAQAGRRVQPRRSAEVSLRLRSFLFWAGGGGGGLVFVAVFGASLFTLSCFDGFWTFPGDFSVFRALRVGGRVVSGLGLRVFGRHLS